MKTQRICIDFDGVIFDEKTREPIPGCKEALTKLQNAGIEIWVYTARGYVSGGTQNAIEKVTTTLKDFLQKHGIPYDDIYFGLKPAADIYLDDHAIEFKGEWAPVIGRILPQKNLKFVMLCGLPGAGKSTFAREQLSHFVRISHDALMGMMRNVEEDNDLYNDIADQAEIKLIQTSLALGKNVVFDRLNLDPDKRAPFLRVAADYNAELVAVVFKLDPMTSWKGNLARDEYKHVTKKTFKKKLKSFKYPKTEEGFDEIWEIHEDDEGKREIVQVE